MNAFWNERYAQPEYAYGVEANLFLQHSLHGLPPGRLLLPAEGEGRNAVHAAKLGWRVDAFDPSERGRDKALSLAEQEGVSINYTIAGFDSAELEEGAYDAMALIFAHCHQDHRRRIHRALARALRSGGLLIMEAYTKEQLRHGTGGPPALEMLYTADDLREDFAGFEIEGLDVVETEIQEGRYHHGLSSVVRLLGRKH